MADYKIVVKLATERNDFLHQSTAHFYIAKCLFELQQMEVSKLHFLKSLSIANNTESIIKESYLQLAILYAGTNFAKQKFYIQKYDSISKTIEKSISEDLLLKYETVKKENEIELLKIKHIENDTIYYYTQYISFFQQ